MSDAKNEQLRLNFHGDLQELLLKESRQQKELHYPLLRKASIKDIIEALGIPHTEVGSITKASRQLDFSYIPQPGDNLDITANSAQFPPTRPTVLRPVPLPSYRFLVDVNVARLAGLLRMVGLDTVSVLEVPELVSKRDVAEAGAASRRILLSRDRELLKLREAIFGRLVRTQQPVEQLTEVITFYRLAKLMSPFSRCLKCNHLLDPVSKEAVIDLLEPLTKKYYHVFKQCSSCSSIYWKGSHHARMLETIAPLVQDQLH